VIGCRNGTQVAASGSVSTSDECPLKEQQMKGTLQQTVHEAAHTEIIRPFFVFFFYSSMYMDERVAKRVKKKSIFDPLRLFQKYHDVGGFWNAPIEAGMSMHSKRLCIAAQASGAKEKNCISFPCLHHSICKILH
jgi:hypothetical protein